MRFISAPPLLFQNSFVRATALSVNEFFCPFKRKVGQCEMPILIQRSKDKLPYGILLKYDLNGDAASLLHLQDLHTPH
ncbi:MAG: hypothetical protein K2F98_10600, partial [Bacteroides sp.]|nr:hypothetical protein [Bacteroides sp.]